MYFDEKVNSLLDNFLLLCIFLCYNNNDYLIRKLKYKKSKHIERVDVIVTLRICPKNKKTIFFNIKRLSDY